ncbi:MAG: IS66 family insertion sequence element accessory protein TnpB, partial [Jannaschia sp.]
IVEESLAGRRLVAATARRHDMARSLLTRWRKLYAEGRLFGETIAGPSFAPVVVAPDPPAAAGAGPDASRIEIVLTNGRRIVIGAGVDATALARVVAVVDRA